MKAASPRTRGYDVVVIGAGLAGLVAAARAAEAGAGVGVVAVSSGSLVFWSGLVSGRLPRTESDGGAQDAGGPTGKRTEAVRFFRDFSERAGLPFASRPRGFELLSAAGHPVRAALAPATMAPGDLGSSRERRAASADRHGGGGQGGLLVVGFTELGDYPAALIADTAARETGLPVIHRSLSLGSAAGRAYAPRLAALFDDKNWFEAFLESAERFLKADTRSAWAVAFPPVLGLLRFGENLAALEECLGCRVFELPAIPPSVPGQRFGRLWRHRLETGGRVQFHTGRRVTGVRVEEGRCLWVDDGSTVYRAGAFVVATGGVAGGGLEVTPQAFFDLSRAGPAASGSLHEPLFNLETCGRGTDWLSWGVRTNREGRPYQLRTARAGTGKPLANVFVAGWELGAFQGRPPGALSSLETGCLAGELAAEWALSAGSTNSAREGGREEQ